MLARGAEPPGTPTHPVPVLRFCFRWLWAPLKVGETLKLLEADGWYLAAMRGAIASTSILLNRGVER